MYQNMNYYVPLQHEEEEEEVPSYKKQRNDKSPQFLEPRYTPRIMGRRFALTSTSYKFLDIGISVGLVSSVEILLGDNRGNHITLPYGTWKALIERQADIKRLVQATETSSLTIYDLIVELVKIRDTNIVKLTSHGACMYLQPSTVLFMSELEHCVENVYNWLFQYLHIVNEKFKNFVTILRQNFITKKLDAVKILRENYDKTSSIDCELLAYALDNILYNTMHY